MCAHFIVIFTLSWWSGTEFKMYAPKVCPYMVWFKKTKNARMTILCQHEILVLQLSPRNFSVNISVWVLFLLMFSSLLIPIKRFLWNHISSEWYGNTEDGQAWIFQFISAIKAYSVLFSLASSKVTVKLWFTWQTFDETV